MSPLISTIAQPLNHTRRLLTVAAVLLIGMASTNASALPDDSQKPINIEADSFDYNQTEGWGEYRGNVVAEQGSLIIKAEVLKVTFAEAGGFEKIEATGNPVNFSMLPEVGAERMVGVGQRLIYTVANKQMEIHTNASITQGGDKMTGNFIQYNVDSTELKARNQGQGRVTVRITPENK